MHFHTKRAIVMLIAVVLWTAAPLFACVPGLETHSHRDCCATMAMPDCPSDSMASGSCCQLAPAPLSVMLDPASTPKYDHHAAAPSWEAYLPPMGDAHAGQPSFNDTPPPDPSPGGFSILRI